MDKEIKQNENYLEIALPLLSTVSWNSDTCTSVGNTSAILQEGREIFGLDSRILNQDNLITIYKKQY